MSSIVPLPRREFIGLGPLALLGLAWASPAGAASAAAPAASGQPTLVHTGELMQAKPNGEPTGSRVWTLHKTEHSRTNLVEMRGELGRHFHPDAEHSLYVIRGEVEVEAGELKTTLKAGD